MLIPFFKLFLFARYNFQPVSVRIFNKINSHRWIFEADTSHLFMFFVSSFEIIDGKCKMDLLFAERSKRMRGESGNSAGNRNFDDYGKPGRDPVTERKRKNPGRV